MDGTSARAWKAILLAGAMSLSGCSFFGGVSDAILPSATPAPGQAGNVQGFLGGVVADEPRAALAGRNVLSAGGSAADAATAMGLMLSVTLPSRAGLGAGGACLVYAAASNTPNGGTPEALMFPTQPPSHPGAADRPASPPMFARALFALQARYGRRPFESLISPAEEAARFGINVSRALVNDIAVVARPLAVDPAARAVFFIGNQPLAEGNSFIQPDLAATLSTLRVTGVGDLYQGQLARRLIDAMPSAGGGLSAEDLRTALPRYVPALTGPGTNGDRIAFPPLPLDGGLATVGALQVLGKTPTDYDAANARALGLATLARRGGTDVSGMLAAPQPASAIGPLPASTTFAALDKDGNAVVCAVSMGNLFGTGRIARGTGILLAASPSRKPQPLLSMALSWNPEKRAFHGLAGGSGQQGAPLAAAAGLFDGFTGQMPARPPEPGRANVIACPGYLPGNSGSCAWSTDPRGSGLAVGSN
jgi:gamma-glutamyltranspeptidase/glutathione hydrolase